MIDEARPSRVVMYLWFTVAIALVVSLIQAPYPEYMPLQHLPTALFLVGWPFAMRRFPLTPVAQYCLVAHLLLHILGARWIYSFVPYDSWTRHLFGFSITEHFHFRRNHYDRLVHLAFGLLYVRPVWEICVRYLRVPRRFAYYVAFEFVLAFSMLYELVEFALAMTLAGPDADAYNGQQGDMWDSQKDMTFALIGATIALVVLWLTRKRRASIVADPITATP